MAGGLKDMRLNLLRKPLPPLVDPIVVALATLALLACTFGEEVDFEGLEFEREDGREVELDSGVTGVCKLVGSRIASPKTSTPRFRNLDTFASVPT